MRLSFKSLNYESFSKDVKKCLSPASKKISDYYTKSNINTIKSILNTFNRKISEDKDKNHEIIEINSRFKKYMDKYYTYKKYFKEKDKHKIKKKSKSAINILIDDYIKKGYKIPNLEKNIFHINPLNERGKIINKYYDEYIKNNKRPVNYREKNFFYLNRLKEHIKAEKFKDNKNMLELNLASNINNQNNKNIDNNDTYSNLFLKNYYKNIALNNKNDKYNFDENENFMKLSEYDQKNLIKLIKDNEDNKNYNEYLEKILKDNKYFETIDDEYIDLDKKKEFKTLNSIKSSNKKILKIKINNNFNDLYEGFRSARNNEINNNNKYLNSNDNLSLKKTTKKKLSFAMSNNYNKIFSTPNKKNSFMGNNIKTISEKDITINKNKITKKLSFSKQQNIEDLLYNIKRSNKIKKTEILGGNIFLKKYKFSGINKNLSKLTKEKSLNYLYNKINEGKIPDNKLLIEYKKYFIRNKNMSENDLNEFINRDYEPKDFFNLVNSVDDKIQKSDIENKWTRNYSKIGKLDERNNILKEEKKQNFFIHHLLQNFILAKYGKIKLYQFQ